MKVAIINYGMGNLGSVRRAFEDLGAETIIASTPDDLLKVDKIVLPGVGAFTQGMARLSAEGWVPALHNAVINRKTPILGICLGMQMLATQGYEGGQTEGLGFIPGEIQKLDNLGCKLRLPHVGWNEVYYPSVGEIFACINSATDFYFVHSYAFVPDSEEYIRAIVNYGTEIVAAIQKSHIFGCQFHPEKSSKAGRQLLKNFLNY
ncbi:imidazole glycerol phosphate synthase subunit HisH [uncultured Paraglaciecola sp.]|uniref:imidazole glycerol phosphate synthase subunit HisH n=1 Tax=uncultured Paraglaciecola sp. TaxID=1765024 RepID=UPI0025CDD3CD|nr:imidazole glycerol phosphate synthase subunit HisH [uncultured Paraglaciecola sp.]